MKTQPEIAFVNKLIRMRLAAERIGANLKPNVGSISAHLKRLIDANGYTKPNESKSFLIRHYESVEYLIPSGKPKLREELLNLVKI